MGCGFVDLLYAGTGPSALVFEFATVQVGGDAVMDDAVADLEPVRVNSTHRTGCTTNLW